MKPRTGPWRLRKAPTKFFALCLAVQLAFSACARSDDGDEDAVVSRTYYASALAVCGLIRTTEAEVLLGYPFEEGEGGFNPDWLIWTGLNACFYENASEAGGNFYSGVVFAYADEIFDGVEERLRPNDEDTHRGVRVGGIGEKALWDPGLGQLMVLTKGKIVGVDIREQELEPRPNRLIRARRLAEKAISRLK